MSIQTAAEDFIPSSAAIEKNSAGSSWKHRDRMDTVSKRCLDREARTKA